MSAAVDLVDASTPGNERVGDDGRLCDEGLERRGGVPMAVAVTELLLKVELAFIRGCRYAGGRKPDWAIFDLVSHSWACSLMSKSSRWVSICHRCRLSGEVEVEMHL